MQLAEKRDLTRWIIIITSFVIVLLIVWNTYTFFQIFKNEERIKMQLWAESLKTINKADLDAEIELPRQIINNNKTIPLILTQNDTIINTANIDDDIKKDQTKLDFFLEEIKKQNKPIQIEYDSGKYWYLYYGDSSLLNKLKYYPIALLLIIFLFATVVYNFYKSNKMGAQNKLWAGMAKETAHQIGTPLSSLIGWLEIMKADNIDPNMVLEIEKDITRLQTITDRFSKIGSEPILEIKDLIQETQYSFHYLQSRFSHQVEFAFKAPNQPISVLINPILHSWTIENLVKNAIDAMKGKGKITITIEADAKNVKINVEDTGKGIPKNQHHKIFEPGFTTKKRGWGLGLSLTKRIVVEYHKGKIKVLHSEIGKGTIIQISYKKSPKTPLIAT